MIPRLKISSALMAVLIALSSLSGPAFAGGVTMVLTPHGDAANLLQTGLQIYSLVEQQKGNKKKNHAKVDQKGSDNQAALSQKGAGNYGLVVQRGKGHTATVSQDGFNNALGVFQFGRNANLDYVQAGNGKASLVLQGGW
jgi:Curlin associated repeat